MDTGSQTIDSFAMGTPAACRPAGEVLRRPSLSLVSACFQLGAPAEAAPADWAEGLARLLGWLRIDAEFVPAPRAGRLAKMTDWAMPSPAARPVPVFAPWLGWAPAAFQHGGLPALPQALWAASYLLDQGRGLAPSQREVDIMLMSPHPSVCTTDEAGGAPLPRTDVLKAMIGTARDEGRTKLAIILHTRQRNAIARQLLAAGRGLNREGVATEILTIEDALRPLTSGAAPWDAIIAMPDVRGIIFTLLRETSGVRGPWPMLWHGGAQGRDLLRITTEAAGEGGLRPALDASALVQALALALDRGGARRAASRLHEAWARLRDSGITTRARGTAAPYVTLVEDARFIAMLCDSLAASQRPVRRWRALGDETCSAPGTRSADLRVVTSPPAVLSG